MKKIILFSSLLLLSAVTFSQQTTTAVPMTKTDYLKKSKTQKVQAFVFLGAGATTLAIISKGNTSLNSVGALLVVGSVLTLGSIPLFIASAKNKRKAMNASAYFKMEEAQQFQGSSFITKTVPSLTLKINL